MRSKQTKFWDWALPVMCIGGAVIGVLLNQMGFGL